MTDRDRRHTSSAEQTVRDIRRATPRKFSAEEKIRIVLEGLRGEETIAALCLSDVNTHGTFQVNYKGWVDDLVAAAGIG